MMIAVTSQNRKNFLSQFLPTCILLSLHLQTVFSSIASTSSINFQPLNENEALRQLNSRTEKKHADDIHYRRSSAIQEDVREYSYYDSQAIYKNLLALTHEYPNLATLQSAQSKYGLPPAGTPRDCPFDHEHTKYKRGCQNWFLTIEDKLAHPKDSESYRSLPEVFLSGALHGNERVGPTAVVETAALLLRAARCEAYPRGNHPTKNSSNDEISQWEDDLIYVRHCRDELASKGIKPRDRKWLARLVTTRRIVVLPTANALGYFRNEREEGHVDPNRDFPYDLNDSQCMLTVAARTINEIFREHMFQLSFTYHAGMSAIGYEWGAPSYNSVLSPDDTAQKQIAQGYSLYAGPMPESWEYPRSYPYGTMNEIVYPVRGGMEDWAYAASWDTKRTSPCHPGTFGGYATEKTIYNNATLRMFNMLVETSKAKEPNKAHLGTTLDIFNPLSEGAGHISRNIRLALMMIDIVEPYIFFTDIENLHLEDDIVPFCSRNGTDCINTKTFKVPRMGTMEKGTLLRWSVGGGFEVTETGLVYAKWEEMPDSFDGSKQPTPDMFDSISKMKRITLEEGGRTRWSNDGAYPSSFSNDVNGPSFSAFVDLNDFDVGDQVAVMAYTMVDQSWKQAPDRRTGPVQTPQSHIVNARTNPDWHFESAGKIIQGREWWFSTPLTLIVKDNNRKEIEANIRYRNELDSFPSEIKEVTDERKEITGVNLIASGVALAGAVLLLGLLVFIMWREKRRNRFREVTFQMVDTQNDMNNSGGDLEMKGNHNV